MTHLKRAALVLGLLLAALFIAPRVIPVPESLLAFGFHQPDTKANEELWASLPMQYANTSICTDCHQVQYGSWAQADHRNVSCENCHGPAADHLAGVKLPQVDPSPELCLTCHEKLISRPARFPQVVPKEHAGQASCITCHNPHDPREGIPPRLPHSMEGRENCQTCHNPTEPLAAIPPHVPHALEGRADCVACHGKTEATQTSLPRIPHTLEGRSDCLVCHNTSAIKPFPANHAGRTTETCRNCHQTE
ncbi:MAG: cytochrome c3 family protein [Chloroflexota bacterium]